MAHVYGKWPTVPIKVALTDAKAKYLLHKAPDNHQLVPTDIIPLITIGMGQENCFGKRLVSVDVHSDLSP
jgi:hypothetical protein